MIKKRIRRFDASHDTTGFCALTSISKPGYEIVNVVSAHLRSGKKYAKGGENSVKERALHDGRKRKPRRSREEATGLAAGGVERSRMQIKPVMSCREEPLSP